MSDATLVKAPKLVLDEDNKVVDGETGEPAHGIVVLNARVQGAEAVESPFTAMKRWGQFRQSLVKPGV
ncbi:MAG: hypothetical protein WDN69_14525 [Aliidongia sp.]